MCDVIHKATEMGVHTIVTDWYRVLAELQNTIRVYDKKGENMLLKIIVDGVIE